VLIKNNYSIISFLTLILCTNSFAIEVEKAIRISAENHTEFGTNLKSSVERAIETINRLSLSHKDTTDSLREKEENLERVKENSSEETKELSSQIETAQNIQTNYRSSMTQNMNNAVEAFGIQEAARLEAVTLESSLIKSRINLLAIAYLRNKYSKLLQDSRQGMDSKRETGRELDDKRKKLEAEKQLCSGVIFKLDTFINENLLLWGEVTKPYGLIDELYAHKVKTIVDQLKAIAEGSQTKEIKSTPLDQPTKDELKVFLESSSEAKTVSNKIDSLISKLKNSDDSTTRELLDESRLLMLGTTKEDEVAEKDDEIIDQSKNSKDNETSEGGLTARLKAAAVGVLKKVSGKLNFLVEKKEVKELLRQETIDSLSSSQLPFLKILIEDLKKYKPELTYPQHKAYVETAAEEYLSEVKYLADLFEGNINLAAEAFKLADELLKIFVQINEKIEEQNKLVNDIKALKNKVDKLKELREKQKKLKDQQTLFNSIKELNNNQEGGAASKILSWGAKERDVAGGGKTTLDNNAKKLTAYLETILDSRKLINSTNIPPFQKQILNIKKNFENLKKMFASNEINDLLTEQKGSSFSVHPKEDEIFKNWLQNLLNHLLESLKQRKMKTQNTLFPEAYMEALSQKIFILEQELEKLKKQNLSKQLGDKEKEQQEYEIKKQELKNQIELAEDELKKLFDKTFTPPIKLNELRKECNALPKLQNQLHKKNSPIEEFVEKLRGKIQTYTPSDDGYAYSDSDVKTAPVDSRQTTTSAPPPAPTPPASELQIVEQLESQATTPPQPEAENKTTKIQVEPQQRSQAQSGEINVNRNSAALKGVGLGMATMGMFPRPTTTPRPETSNVTTDGDQQAVQENKIDDDEEDEKSTEEEDEETENENKIADFEDIDLLALPAQPQQPKFNDDFIRNFLRLDENEKLTLQHKMKFKEIYDAATQKQAWGTQQKQFDSEAIATALALKKQQTLGTGKTPKSFERPQTAGPVRKLANPPMIPSKGQKLLRRGIGQLLK
jgi:hypothetical protein